MCFLPVSPTGVSTKGLRRHALGHMESEYTGDTNDCVSLDIWREISKSDSYSNASGRYVSIENFKLLRKQNKRKTKNVRKKVPTLALE